MRSDAQRIRHRIAALEKRAAWLGERIATSTQDLSYDKQELSALTWAIPLLRGMFAEVLSPPSTDIHLSGQSRPAPVSHDACRA